jgi:hypothetical protein
MVPTVTAFRLERVKPIVHINDLWNHSHWRWWLWLSASHDMDNRNSRVYSALLLGWLALLRDLLVSLLLLALLRDLLVSLLLLALLRDLLVSLLLLALLRHLLALLQHLLLGWKVLISRRQWGLLL